MLDFYGQKYPSFVHENVFFLYTKMCAFCTKMFYFYRWKFVIFMHENVWFSCIKLCSNKLITKDNKIMLSLRTKMCDFFAWKCSILLLQAYKIKYLYITLVYSKNSMRKSICISFSLFKIQMNISADLQVLYY